MSPTVAQHFADTTIVPNSTSDRDLIDIYLDIGLIAPPKGKWLMNTTFQRSKSQAVTYKTFDTICRGKQGLSDFKPDTMGRGEG